MGAENLDMYGFLEMGRQGVKIGSGLEVASGAKGVSDDAKEARGYYWDLLG